MGWVLRLWANRTQPREGRPSQGELVECELTLQRWLGTVGRHEVESWAELARRFDELPQLLRGLPEIDQRYLRALGEPRVQDRFLSQTGRQSLQSHAVAAVGGGTKYREHLPDLYLALARRLLQVLNETRAGRQTVEDLVRCLDLRVPTVAELFAGAEPEAPPVATWYGFAGEDGALPGYLRRVADEGLDYRLRQAVDGIDSDSPWHDRLLLVLGPPRSGRTRSVLEALNRHEVARHLPFHDLIDIDLLGAYVPLARAGSILVLDAVDRRLRMRMRMRMGTGSSSWHTLLRSVSILLDAGVIVIMTMDAAVPDGAHGLRGPLPEDRAWLCRRPTVRIAAGLDDRESEWHGLDPGYRLGEASSARRDLLQLCGEHGRLERGDAAARAAVVAGLCDAALFAGAAVPVDRIHALAEPYWRASRPTQRLSRTVVEAELDALSVPPSAPDSTASVAVYEADGDAWQLSNLIAADLLPRHETHYEPDGDECFTAALRLLILTPADGHGSRRLALYWLARAAESGRRDAATLRRLLLAGGRRPEGVAAVANPELLDRMAKACHEGYLTRAGGGTGARRSAAAVPWPQLPATFRRANLEQARGIWVQLDRLGFSIERLEDQRGRGADELSGDERWAYAVLEHHRWVAERIGDGWRFGRRRSLRDRTHPDIRPWSDLSDHAVDLDLAVAEVVPHVLRTAGLALRRRAA